MNDELEEIVEEEMNIKTEELRIAMKTGDYKKANKILDMLSYCTTERDDTDVMVA